MGGEFRGVDGGGAQIRERGGLQRPYERRSHFSGNQLDRRMILDEYSTCIAFDTI
jgi:hypothetical protein